jgi:hypothetical protein
MVEENSSVVTVAGSDHFVISGIFNDFRGFLKFFSRKLPVLCSKHHQSRWFTAFGGRQQPVA